MHPIFLTSPIITAIIGPLVVFAACKQSHAMTVAPAQTRSSSHQPRHRFIPQCLPAAPKLHRAISISSFFLVTLKSVDVIYGDVCQRQFSCYQSVPISEGSSPQLLYCKSYSQTSHYTSGYQEHENLQPGLLWPSFFSFFCGWKTYLPVRGRVGRIWPVALFLLEKSHGDVGTLETSWSALSSRVFLNLTCEVRANKQGQIPVMPLRVVAPGARHSVGLHFSASVGTVFF